MKITKIGFIGLGAMGMSMAKNLLSNGFAVRGFDIRPAAMAMHVSPSGAGAGDDSQIIRVYHALNGG